MDADLAAAAATALVTSMTTDSWEQAKAALVKLLHPRHPIQAKAVAADLTAAQTVAVAAWAAGDEQAEADLMAEWRSRLGRMAARDEQLQAELKLFAEEFRHLLSEPRRTSRIVMRAEVHGSGRVNQAGGNQTVISS
jgi:hypothetical protein